MTDAACLAEADEHGDAGRRAALERMTLEQDQRISDVVTRERSRLGNFIRRRFGFGPSDGPEAGPEAG